MQTSLLVLSAALATAILYLNAAQSGPARYREKVPPPAEDGSHLREQRSTVIGVAVWAAAMMSLGFWSAEAGDAPFWLHVMGGGSLGSAASGAR
jgi:hypothetical protein